MRNLLLTTLLLLPLTSHAALVGRLAATEGGTDYQAYYDDVADLTWLTDANYARTTDYANGGQMQWDDAMDWVSGLNISGVTGWRLPETLQPDASCSGFFSDTNTSYGYNCLGSEMGNMFFNVLGGAEGTSIVDTHNSNYDLFTNIQTSLFAQYWSSTEYVPDNNGTTAWYFNFENSHQFRDYKVDRGFAWAVQSGDVSAVPVSAAVWLFGSGLIGLVGFARRKSNA